MRQIAAGYFSAVVTQDSRLLLFGLGEFGNYTSPRFTSVNAKIASVTVSKQENAAIAAVDNNGVLFMWGCNNRG